MRPRSLSEYYIVHIVNLNCAEKYWGHFCVKVWSDMCSDDTSLLEHTIYMYNDCPKSTSKYLQMVDKYIILMLARLGLPLWCTKLLKLWSSITVVSFLVRHCCWRTHLMNIWAANQHTSSVIFLYIHMWHGCSHTRLSWCSKFLVHLHELIDWLKIFFIISVAHLVKYYFRWPYQSYTIYTHSYYYIYNIYTYYLQIKLLKLLKIDIIVIKIESLLKDT